METDCSNQPRKGPPDGLWPVNYRQIFHGGVREIAKANFIGK